MTAMPGAALDRPVSEAPWDGWQPAFLGAFEARVQRADSLVRFALGFAHRGAMAVLWSERARFLHPSERRYAESLAQSTRRETFVLGRYALKRALARLASSAFLPSEVEVARGVFGQPVVHHWPSPPAVSITHAGDLAFAVACDPGHVVGIDFDLLLPECDPTRQRALSEREREMARPWELSEPHLALVSWTMKEALSKALRSGLMASFELLALEGASREGATFSAEFSNFRQYRACAWQLGDATLALVLPKHSRLVLETDELARLRGLVNLPRAAALAR